MQIGKLISVILLASVSVLNSARAADVTCIDTYGNANGQFIPKVDIFNKWFPSGRLPSASTCMGILIRGNIETGDSLKFLKILRENHPFVEEVYLASSGGSVEEGIQIGRLVRKYMLTTYAPTHNTLSPEMVEERTRKFLPLFLAESAKKAEASNPGDVEFAESVRIRTVQKLYNKVRELEQNYKADEGSLPLHNGHKPEIAICKGPDCHCASSCFIIWSAGAMRLGSAIGIHRPSIHAPEFSSLPPDEASTVYRKELTEISQYLSDMEVPQKYIDIMTETASNDIYWLGDEEAGSMEVYPPSIAESMSASCGSQDRSEIDVMNKIEFAMQEKFPVSQQEEALYKKLGDQNYKILECVVKKCNNYRDSIVSIK